MTDAQWHEIFRDAVCNASIGMRRDLERLIAFCQEADAAKQLLRERGYGVTGTGLLETARLVPPNS